MHGERHRPDGLDRAIGFTFADGSPVFLELPRVRPFRLEQLEAT